MPNINIFTSDDEENSENSDTLCSPWFQVDLKKVKPKAMPSNGEEFLASVIAERRKISAVTICDIDYSKLNKNQSKFVQEVHVPAAPDKFKPTIEWQNLQVADFSDLRMNVSRILANCASKPKKIKTIVNMKDNLAWWKEFFEGNEPTLSCVLGLNGSKMDRGLVMLTLILKQLPPGDTITHRTGQWIYSILACRKLPLISDSISILRDLARECAIVRSLIDTETENALDLATPLNLIICLVGRYFRQLDLAD